MALDHRSKVFGVAEARVVKLLTDNAGAAATYSGVTTAVVASPAPTTTTFSVTAATGANLIVGRAITVGTAVTAITAIATDAITVSPALPAAPSTGATVFMTTGYPLTGAKGLVYTPQMKTVDLRGDNTFLDTDSVLQSISFELTMAKINFDVIALMLGGTVTDSGTTPNQQTSWSLPDSPTFNYFRLEARCKSADPPAGDIHIILNKVKAADAPLVGFVEEDYDYPKLKLKPVPPNGTTPWLQIVMNETALPVAA